MDKPKPCSSMLSDLESHEYGMVVSKSFLDSTRRMVESLLGYSWSGCWMVEEMVGGMVVW